MRFIAKIRTSFDCNTNTFRPRFFRKLYRFLYVRRAMARERIMQISDKKVSIIFIETHKRTSHNNKFYLINIMSKRFKLIDSIFCLDIRIISSPNCTHTCRLITSVRLSWILKIWIGAPWTVNANIPCDCYMRTTMGFTHDCYYGYSACCSNWLCF